MVKINPKDSQEVVLKKILSGEATLEGLFVKELEEIWELEAFLNKHNRKLPKCFKDLEKEMHRRNLSWKPF